MTQGGVRAAHSTNKNSLVIPQSGDPVYNGKKSAGKPAKKFSTVKNN